MQRVLHYTTTRLGDLLDSSPGSPVVAFLYRGRHLIKSTKAPKIVISGHAIPSGLLAGFRCDPLYWGAIMRSKRKQGFSTEQVPVSAFGGSLKNLKDLKDGVRLCWELEEPEG